MVEQQIVLMHKTYRLLPGALSDQLQVSSVAAGPLAFGYFRGQVAEPSNWDPSSWIRPKSFRVADLYGTALTVAPASIEQQFHGLVSIWENDTFYQSSLDKIWDHPAYHQIIELGYQAVPLILQEIEVKGVLWFKALNSISGEDPVREDEYGLAAVRAWQQWGERRGYLGRSS